MLFINNTCITDVVTSRLRISNGIMTLYDIIYSMVKIFKSKQTFGKLKMYETIIRPMIIYGREM